MEPGKRRSRGRKRTAARPTRARVTAPKDAAKAATRPKAQSPRSQKRKTGRDNQAPEAMRSAKTDGLRKKITTRKSTTLRRRKPYASMRFFSNAKAVRADLSRKPTRVVGSYLSAVRRFRDTNDIEPLEQFIGKSVKDVRGTVFPLETRPNVLYRLSASIEPLEEFYRRIT
ncbi:MAG TPA: hypothetical protein VGU20_24105 [Stellaceae bacterium]|nr:hypothetical protein [Stellaceae bacterium]